MAQHFTLCFLAFFLLILDSHAFAGKDAERRSGVSSTEHRNNNQSCKSKGYCPQGSDRRQNRQHYGGLRDELMQYPNFTDIHAGVTYSRLANNLPPPQEAILLAYRRGFKYVRIYTPHHDALRALRNIGLDVMVCVPNQDIVKVAFTKNFAKQWVNNYINTYKTSIFFHAIVVGHGIKAQDSLAHAILPAMQAIKDALDPNDFDTMDIYVTTELNLSWLSSSFPPSAGTFTFKSIEVVKPILEFLRTGGAVLYLELYPVLEFFNNPDYARISMDYPLLSSKSPLVKDVEFEYTNMLDGLMDAFHYAMEKIGIEDIWINVGETGWPIKWGRDGLRSMENAQTYITNVFDMLKSRHVSPKGRWPPRTFIYNLFLQAQAPAEKAYFGLFYPNMTATMPLFQ